MSKDTISDFELLLFSVIGIVVLIIGYNVLWHIFRLFEKWFSGTEREGFFDSLESAQDAEWWFRKRKASPTTEPWKPSKDFHIGRHKDGESKVLCKECDKPLKKAQIDYMLGKPKYNEWCREGYCNLECFEKHRDGKQRGN